MWTRASLVNTFLYCMTLAIQGRATQKLHTSIYRVIFFIVKNLGPLQGSFGIYRILQAGSEDRFVSIHKSWCPAMDRLSRQVFSNAYSHPARNRFRPSLAPTIPQPNARQDNVKPRWKMIRELLGWQRLCGGCKDDVDSSLKAHAGLVGAETCRSALCNKLAGRTG